LIEDIQVNITFTGDKFSPKAVEERSGAIFNTKNEVGDIGKLGRFKDQPIPYGSGELIVPDEVPAEDKLTWLTKRLGKLLPIALAAGAEVPNIDVTYFCKDQCNLALSKTELKALAELLVFSFND